MNTAQTLLQRGLSALDSWLDAVFPLATALICARQRIAGYSLLVMYLLLRLLQRSDREPWRWILFSLLAINAGLIIQDQDIKPGGPSDYLIIAISFTAGYQRTRQQWKTSLAWISSCAIPLLVFSLKAGDAMIEGNSSFAGFNINKIGFLAGFLSVLSYGLLRQADDKPTRACALTFLVSALWAAILTESRSAIAIPLVIICIDRLMFIRWTPKKLALTLFISILVFLATTYSWYGEHSKSGNYIGDLNRIETIKCWATTPFTSSNYSILFGDGFSNSAKEACGPDRIPSLAAMGKSKGLAHAHNIYAQLISEAGLLGLALASAATIKCLSRGYRLCAEPSLSFTFLLSAYIFLMGLGITYWQVMMINQVLVGYSLAALTATDRAPSAADAATPATPPGASAPQG